MAVDERAVRLALTLAAAQHRAEQAEATLARIQALADHWHAIGNPAATELQRTLSEGPKAQ